MSKGTIEDPWDEEAGREERGEPSEWQLLKETLAKQGFEEYKSGEWCKLFYGSGRYIQATYDGTWINFNFNEEKNVYVSPKFIINFFKHYGNAY